MEEITREITDYKKKHRQLCHAANILKKAKKGENASELSLIAEKYLSYLRDNMEIIGYSDDIIKKRVEYLNNYYNFIHNRKFDNIFSSQGKFRPTILEEFLFLLFKDFVGECQIEFDAKTQLDSGSVKAYSNLFFKAKSFEDFIVNPEISVNQKNQDFAIYRKLALSLNERKKIKLQIPAVAIEAKTYIDKTMLDGIIAAAEKIKNGNPYSLFIAVTETYDVSLDVDPAYSQIDQIYVLRKTTPKKLKSNWLDIDADVVLRMFHEVKAHLERPWSDVRTRLLEDGVII